MIQDFMDSKQINKVNYCIMLSMDNRLKFKEVVVEIDFVLSFKDNILNT